MSNEWRKNLKVGDLVMMRSGHMAVLTEVFNWVLGLMSQSIPMSRSGTPMMIVVVVVVLGELRRC